jgi:hypothetical protein
VGRPVRPLSFDPESRTRINVAHPRSRGFEGGQEVVCRQSFVLGHECRPRRLVRAVWRSEKRSSGRGPPDRSESRLRFCRDVIRRRCPRGDRRPARPGTRRTAPDRQRGQAA